MLASSTSVVDIIREALVVQATPRVIAEWNHNRYTPVATVDNWGSTEDDAAFDPDIYPIESIVSPIRPTSGILIAKTNEGTTSKGFSEEPGEIRSYTATADSKYKHWTSQDKAGSAGVMDPLNASPYILYNDLVWTNKIYLCFEVSWAKPTEYDISVTTDGTTWTTVASDIAVPNDGKVELYLQNDGSWGTTRNLANQIRIKGVRVVVNHMSLGSAFLNLVEMGLRLEHDLSLFLVDYSVNFELSDEDIVSPLGDISSNGGSVTLSNLDGRFNNASPGGVDDTPWYRGLIDANTKFTIDLGINTGGTNVEWIRQGTMFADIWGTTEETAEVTLKDASKFLQELKPLASLLKNVSVGSAIWRLLDSVGFNDYEYSKSATSKATRIKWYWTDGVKTVWDEIRELCRTTQSTAYFDAFGVLQIKTRDDAFDLVKKDAPSWAFSDEPAGTVLPDIVDLNENASYEVNRAKVTYRPTSPAVTALGTPQNEVVWKPETDVVLRASALKHDMDADQMHFMIDPAEATYWPYEGMVNIRGELIKYKGKQYRYIDRNQQWQTTYLYNSDDKEHVDNDLSSRTRGWQNSCTGRIEVTRRGYDWTVKRAHEVTIQPWINAGPAKGELNSNTMQTWTGGLHHLRDQSILRINTNSNFTQNTIYCAPHGSVSSVPSTNIGTRFRFPRGTGSAQDQHAGIFFYANGDMTNCYLLDIMTSSALEGRDDRSEIRLIKRTGTTHQSISGPGRDHAIVEGLWYDIDITVNGDIFSVFINGRHALDAGDTELAHTGKVGLFVRGNAVVDFEYFYHAGTAGWPTYETESDSTTYLDLIRGGYYSDQFYKDGYYRTKTARRRHGKRSQKYKQKYANRFFDEFGMVVHEVRKFKVDFEKVPVLNSFLYNSNPDQCVTIEYIATPFAAEFMMANASRGDVIINGDDTSLGGSSPVNRQLFVYARTLQQQEEKTIDKKSEEWINTRGEISIDINSDWIQTEAAADDLADWIVGRWSVPADSIDVTLFGNPLVEVGDVVSVNYAPKNMKAGTHKYFVLSVGHNWDNGLETTVSLRRAH